MLCFEQADQTAALDELAAVSGTDLTERAVTLQGIGRTIQVAAVDRHGSGQQAVTAVAIPYFQWDNRGPGAMRVWIPAADGL